MCPNLQFPADLAHLLKKSLMKNFTFSAVSTNISLKIRIEPHFLMKKVFKK